MTDRSVARTSGGGSPERRARLPVAPLVALGWLAWAILATRDWAVPQPGGIAFVPLLVGGVAVVMAFLRWRLGRVGWLELLVAGVAVGAVLTDITQLPSQFLRDWHLYIKAAERWTSGEPVYLQGLVTQVPADRTNYPFLYPPLTLPLFALFAALPSWLGDPLWLALSIGAIFAAFRMFGIPARWWLPLLVWTPVFQGLYVGNVAVPAALLFAVAPRWGGGLVLTGVFKLYSGLASLWLLRERHWRSFWVGVVIVGALALATLPLTGLDLWRQWLVGLDWYRRSQPLLPTSLYGYGLPRYGPEWIAYVAGGAAVLLALRARGRDGLAWFGLATVVASPSLFAHGFIVALPAFLLLAPVWTWLAIGITSIVPGDTFWFAVLLAAAAYLGPWLRRRPVAGPSSAMDLLAGGPGPWPEARFERGGPPGRTGGSGRPPFWRAGPGWAHDPARGGARAGRA